MSNSVGSVEDAVRSLNDISAIRKFFTKEYTKKTREPGCDKTIDCKYAEEVITIRGGKTEFKGAWCGVGFCNCIGADICPIARKERKARAERRGAKARGGEQESEAQA